jgi:uncharacterized protein (TIGR03066 family)
MKNLLIVLISGFILFSCGNSNDSNSPEEVSIVGKWTLYKEDKKGKSVDYKGVPAATKIEFKENGYFILFDEITDEKINNESIGSIQEDYKGQYELKNKDLIMNRFDGDSSSTETLVLQELTSDKLMLKSQDGRVRYFKR